MQNKIQSHVTEVQLSYRNKVKAKDRPQIVNSRDAHLILKSNWSNQIGLVEEFNILLLDRSNRVLAMCPISKGGISSTVVDIRIVFATALKGRSSSLILSHNHPSGNAKPSQADIELTKKFKQAGSIMDIKILDHIILCPDNTYFSFKDEACIL